MLLTPYNQNQTMTFTTIQIPESVLFVFKSLWKAYLSTPSKGDMTAYCLAQAKRYPVSFNDKSARIPYCGSGAQLTIALKKALLASVEAVSLSSNLLTESETARLTNKINSWHKNGEFKYVTPKKRLKTIKSKRHDYVVTPDEQRRRQKLEPVIKKFINELVADYTRLSYKLFPDLPHEIMKSLNVTFSNAPSITRSCGGRKARRPYIKFAISRIMIELEDQGEVLTFNEYPEFCDDPIIGSVRGGMDVYLSALVAHELSHAIQFSIVFKDLCVEGGWNGMSEEQLWEGHGEGWQYIYKQLRSNTTNKLSSLVTT